MFEKKPKWKLGKVILDVPGRNDEWFAVLFNHGWPFGYREIDIQNLRFKKRADAMKMLESLRNIDVEKFGVRVIELE